MAELMFKRGSQANLNKLTTFDDGCFYLTTDTNRLYVGQKQSDNKVKAVLLNQTVQIVDTIDNLPTNIPEAVNDFYYCIDENVLAVFDGTKWQQINANTNDVVEVSGLSFDQGALVVDETSGKNTGVAYEVTLSQQTRDLQAPGAKPTPLDDITATLFLDTELIAGIVPESASVGLKTKVVTNGAEIYTDGSGSDATTNVHLIAGDNISIDAANKEITITADDTEYTVSTTDHNEIPSIELLANTGAKDYIGFASGNDDLLVSQADDTITYQHKTYSQPSVDTNPTGITELAPSDALRLITNIQVSNGHIQKLETTDYTLPFDTYVDSISHKGDWVADVNMNVAGQAPHKVDFSAEAAALESSLKDYIDKGIENANTALTYKGSVENYDDLARLTNVEVGDVYMFATFEEQGDEVVYRAGDLFIARSSEATDTGIIEGTVIWDHVPSGNEYDTQYKGIVAIGNNDTRENKDAERNGHLSYYIEAVTHEEEGHNFTPKDNAHFQIVAGNDLEILDVSGEQPDDPGLDNPLSYIAQIRHKDISTTPTTTSEQYSPDHVVISDLVIDNGHITGYTKTTITDNTYSLSGANNKISLMDANGAKCGDVSVGGDTWISVGVAGNKLSVAHQNPSTTATTVKVTNQQELAQLGDLNILTSVSYDEKGHITEVLTDTLKLPQDTTYTFGMVADVTGTAISTTHQNPVMMLTDVNGARNSVKMYGHNNVEIVASSNQVDVKLTWGSF